MPMPEIDVFKEQNEFDPVFKVVKKAYRKKKVNNAKTTTINKQ